VLAVPVHGARSVRVHHRSGSVRGSPAVYLLERIDAAILGAVERRLIASGSPYEPIMGFSRAVRVGAHVFVAGTAPVMPEGVDLPSDAYGQTRRCLDIIVAALEEAGAKPEHVVRTRIYATSADFFDEVARAHGERFRDIRPANAYIVVRAFVDPRWLVEIEADAYIA
jgi:enamine deaminase RidA (YjgF/YER057c/UK114 family)